MLTIACCQCSSRIQLYGSTRDHRGDGCEALFLAEPQCEGREWAAEHILIADDRSQPLPWNLG